MASFGKLIYDLMRGATGSVGIATVSEYNELVERGCVRIAATTLTIPATETRYFMIDIPADADVDILLREFRSYSTTPIDVDITVEFIQGVTVTDNGTPITAYNADLNLPATSIATIYINPTGVTGGTTIPPLGGRLIGEASKEFFSNNKYKPLVGAKTVLKVTNNNTSSANTLEFYWSWVERDTCA